MAYIKPLSPIKSGEDFIYPLTSYDQIIMEDGSRWDGTIVGFNTVKVDLEDAEEGTPALTNADMLGNRLAEEYALKSEVEGLTGGIQMELLWENASSTSEFAAQTVALDLSAYQFVGIFFRWTVTSEFADQPLAIQAKGTGMRYIGGVGAGSNVSRRIDDINDVGIVFGPSFSGTTSEIASTMIPISIYGIKGVS